MTYRSYTSPPAHHRGFTLIELLVVVAIIAILAALGFGGFKLATDKAKEAQAKKTLSDLVMASDAFYDQYNYLPLNEGESTDVLRKSDNELMSILVGNESAQDQNPSLTKFFTAEKAKGKGQKAFAGLFQTDSEALLYGPWRLKNEDEKLYRIVYDYDYDEVIEEQEGVGTDRIRGRRQIAYLLGKDGKAGPGGANADNIYSYR